MSSSSKVLYISRFEPDPEGDGGHRWTAQVLDLLEPFQPEFVSLKYGWRGQPPTPLPDTRSGPLLPRVLAAIRRRWICGRDAYWWRYPRTQYLFHQREAAWRLARNLAREFPRLRAAVIDDPVILAPLWRELVRRCVPFAAICHNIESLVPSQVRSGKQAVCFNAELRLYGASRIAITISYEEEALLHSFGVRAACLPYFPAAEVREQLAAIRARRSDGAAETILMVGSAGNAPTADGIRRVCRHWQEQKLAGTYGPLRVAGYDSEGVGIRGGGVELLGALSWERLADEMVQARAAVCFQEEGAGALTRIRDLMLAGVPVVANSHATRSYRGMPGLVEFVRVEDLPDALERAAEISAEQWPDLLQPPDVAGLRGLLAEVLSL